MLTRAWTRLLPLAAAGVVAGCGGASTHQTTPPVIRESDHAPADYRVRTVAQDGFSIAFPRRWQVVNHYDVQNAPGIVSSLATIYPKLRNAVTAVGEPGSAVKLVGFDTRTARRTPTTVSVIVARAPRGPFATWTKTVVQGVRTGAAKGARVTQRSLQLPAGRALVLTYSRRVTGSRVTSAHAFVVRGGRLFIVTVTGASHVTTLLERIARTLTVVASPQGKDPGGIPDANTG
jgi:hypothetical protein